MQSVSQKSLLNQYFIILNYPNLRFFCLYVTGCNSYIIHKIFCYIYDNISSFSNNSESFPGIPSTKIFASPSGAHSNSPSTHFTVI